MGLTEEILKNDRICSRHFILGKPAEVLDVTSPNWLPSLNLGPLFLLLLLQKDGKLERCKLVSEKLHNTQVVQTEYPTVSETEFVETVCSDDGSVAGFRTCNMKCTSKVFYFTFTFTNTNTASALCNVCKSIVE